MDDELALVRAVLSLTVPRWRAIVEAVPREALERPAADGEWSAGDCLRHLAGSERLWTLRLRDFRDGRKEATLQPATEHEPARSPGELLAVLAEQREEDLTLLAGFAGDAAAATMWHPQRGAFTLDAVLNAWAAHDLQHTVQAEEALMQPLIRRSGYLRPVFADHDVEARSPRG